jgi:hypothetical protein
MPIAVEIEKHGSLLEFGHCDRISSINDVHRRKGTLVQSPCLESRLAREQAYHIKTLFRMTRIIIPIHSSVAFVLPKNMSETCCYLPHPQYPSMYNIVAFASTPYSPAAASLFAVRRESSDPVLDSLLCRGPTFSLVYKPQV